MARPLTRTHRLELRLSPEDHAALSGLGRPLGPAIVAAALGRRPPALGSEAPPPTGTPLDALEAFRIEWLPSIRKTRANVRLVMQALDAIAVELRA